MFAAASMPVERPAKWRSNSYHNACRSPRSSPPTSPSVSRRSSVSSIASAQTEPGVSLDRSRQSSVASTTSASSSRSGFKALFGKKEKKPKEKKDVDKIVLTSKHAAAVKTKMMMDAYNRKKPDVKTAGIVSNSTSRHSSAAEQEARHPHSGPPSLHGKNEMPALTRIVSGDERDDEDEFAKLERVRLEWAMAKAPGVFRIREHDGDSSANTSAEQSDDEGDTTPPVEQPLSPSIEKALYGTESRRPVVVAKNSYGGRFHRDEKGHWKR